MVMQVWGTCAGVKVETLKLHLDLAFLPHDVLDLLGPQQRHSPFHAVLEITNFTRPIPGSHQQHYLSFCAHLSVGRHSTTQDKQ